MRLSARYAVLQIALVAGCLLIAIGIEMSLAYKHNIEQVGILANANARSVATRIQEHFAQIEKSVAEIAGLPYAAGALSETDRHAEYLRLLKLFPSIESVRHRTLREELHYSRISPVRRVSLGLTEGANPHTLGFEAVEFREGSVPYVTFAVAEKTNARNTMTAVIDLRFLDELLIPPTGRGSRETYFVVDKENRIIGHPAPALVLAKRNLSANNAVIDARKRESISPDVIPVPVRTIDLFGSDVISVATPIGIADWLVVAEIPASVALQPVFDVLERSLAVLLVAIVFAGAVGIWLALQMARPIVALRNGVRAFGQKKSNARVFEDAPDEVGDLAREFNKMASQLQSYATSLEQKVSEKTAQLELANRHKSEFLANMSHELRTPLNAVIGFSEALNAEYFGKLNPKQQEYVKDIHESGQHLLSLINDILDLSKIEAGHMELELSSFSLPAAIENAFVLVRERATRQQLQLRETIAPDVVDVVADQRKIKQVLINLLTNAVKFSHPGGWVDVVVRRDTLGADGVVVTVRDTGIGIAPEDHAHIFQEFQQVKSAGSAKQEGTGLGLTLVKRLVELHGGRVWVESALGQGAAFSFSLPERLPVENGIEDKQTPTGERDRSPT